MPFPVSPLKQAFTHLTFLSRLAHSLSPMHIQTHANTSRPEHVQPPIALILSFVIASDSYLPLTLSVCNPVVPFPKRPPAPSLYFHVPVTQLCLPSLSLRNTFPCISKYISINALTCRCIRCIQPVASCFSDVRFDVPVTQICHPMLPLRTHFFLCLWPLLIGTLVCRWIWRYPDYRCLEGEGFHSHVSIIFRIAARHYPAGKSCLNLRNDGIMLSLTCDHR